VQSDVSISTERLRNRMHQEGLNENLIEECEQIILSEFSNYRKQLKRRYEDYLSMFGSCRRHFEVEQSLLIHLLWTEVLSSRLVLKVTI
jgi:oxysterol-binding protein 1